MGQKGFAPVLVIVVIAIVAIVGAYYLGSNKVNILITPTQAPASNTPAQTTPTIKPKTDPTINWKTYTNTKYGFSFKYPNSLSGTVGAVASPYTGTSEPIRTFSDPTTIREGTDAPFDGFSLYVVTDTKTPNFDGYIQNEKTAMDTSPNAFMSGATRVNIDLGAALVNSNKGYYYLHSSDNKMTVAFAYNQANESFRTTFNQILSTFKFTK